MDSDSYSACFSCSPCCRLSLRSTRYSCPQKRPVRPPDKPASSHHTDWWSSHHSPCMNSELFVAPLAPFWGGALASRWSPASIWASDIGCTWVGRRNYSFSIGSRPSHHLGSWTNYSTPTAIVTVLLGPLKYTSLALALILGGPRTVVARSAKPSFYIWDYRLPLRCFVHQTLYGLDLRGYSSFLCLGHSLAAVVVASNLS